jgi:hypothetical protein
MILPIERMWSRRRTASGGGQPFTHEQYFVHRRRKRIYPLGAFVIVEVQVCHVEELLQPAHGGDVVL